MHQRSPNMLNARAVARALLAAALAFAVLTGTVPLGSASGAHGCSMPCCKGADGMPGDCTGGSCPVSHLKKHGAGESAHSDQSHEAEADASAHTAAPSGMHHAAPGHASTHEPDADRTGHSAHRHVATRGASTEHAFSSASLSKPCPPDCGGILNASTQLRRARGEAALSSKLQPRPPNGELRTQDPFGVAEISSALRRQYPPRAPPTISTTQPA